MPYAAAGKISQSQFEGAIEISEAQYQEALLGKCKGKDVYIDDGVFRVDFPPEEVEPPEPEPTASEIKESALNRVDYAAGLARLRYVSAGQLIEEEYRQALTAVQEWRAAGSPADSVPPEIISGAEYSDITHEAAAVEIEQTAATWEGVLAQIRDLRLIGKRAVREASDADIETTAQSYIDQLEAMKPEVPSAI